jgi:hypothetical protein
MNTRTDQPDSEALVLGELLVAAGESYLDWWEAFAIRPSSKEDTDCAQAVRESGQEHAELFAYMSRSLAIGDSELAPPESALRCFRALADSYVLMSTVTCYDHLMQLPLATPDEIAADLAAPETERWLRETGVIR